MQIMKRKCAKRKEKRKFKKKGKLKKHHQIHYKMSQIYRRKLASRIITLKFAIKIQMIVNNQIIKIA